MAEAIPPAASSVPHPAAFEAGEEGEADTAERGEQVAEAEVDQEEADRRAEPLELGVEHQNQQVVAQAQDADGGREPGEQLVSASAKQRAQLRRRRRLGALLHQLQPPDAAAVPVNPASVHGCSPARGKALASS